MSRVIGLHHRVKKTADGEARPTQLVILDDDNIITHDLEDENAELDFVLARFPTSFRKPADDEDLKKFLPYHIGWRKIAADKRDQYPVQLLKQKKKLWYRAVFVPETFDGLKTGDTVAMVLGGSGDNLAYALSRCAELLKARILRIPPIRLKKYRISGKEDDALNLAQLVIAAPELFYPTEPRDRDIINIRETYRARMYCMEARIACQLRVRQNLVGQVFRSNEGKFPEGAIEAEYNKAKANNVILKNLTREERKCDTKMLAALKASPVYTEIFEPIEGIGPAIAAGIISTIVDIRRFPAKPGFRKFCGVHCTPDGKFPKRRRLAEGETGNDWTPEARQAFFLAAEQFNFRPGSEWNMKLKERKAYLRAKHSEVKKTPDGKVKSKYSPLHILRMSKWQAATKFANWLWGNWWALERRQQKAREAA
ncbi:MAG: hypothetical protein WDN47_00040 [Candidatus Doudnabacteria bacterium]